MSTLKAKHFHFIEEMDIAAGIFALVERVESSVARVDNTVRVWARRSADRRALAQMNERMLTDIGLTRADVDREAAKFFWQP